MSKMKLYLSLSNGDYNGLTDLSDIGWELGAGCQDYVLITKKKLTKSQYIRIDVILREGKK